MIEIDREIELKWLDWMRDQHIPDTLKTGAFIRYEFYRVLSHKEKDTISFCVQYYSPNIKKFNLYLKHHAPKLIERHKEMFQDRHVAFRTLLEKI